MTPSMRDVFFYVMAALFLIAASTHAQVNTEKLRLGRTKAGVGGQVGLDYSVELGNTELTEIGLNANFVARTGANLFFWLNDYSRIYSDDDTIKNKGFTHGRYNRDIVSWLIWEGFAQASYSRTADLDERLLAGTGPRFVVVQDTLSLLAVGIAAMYEYEELAHGSTSELIRGSSYISLGWRKPSRFRVSATTYFQPSIKRMADLRVLSEVQLSIELWRALRFDVTVDYAYDSEPPEGVKEYDLAVKNGVNFSF